MNTKDRWFTIHEQLPTPADIDHIGRRLKIRRLRVRAGVVAPRRPYSREADSIAQQFSMAEGGGW
jgi:hypothetical protein